MTTLALLHQLHALGVVLTPSPDGSVHCRAPKGVLTPDLVDAMRQHKAALHSLVEVFEERAGLIEFDGGLERQAAEALAWECVLGEIPEQAPRTPAPATHGKDLDDTSNIIKERCREGQAVAPAAPALSALWRLSAGVCRHLHAVEA